MLMLVSWCHVLRSRRRAAELRTLESGEAELSFELASARCRNANLEAALAENHSNGREVVLGALPEVVDLTGRVLALRQLSEGLRGDLCSTEEQLERRVHDANQARLAKTHKTPFKGAGITLGWRSVVRFDLQCHWSCVCDGQHVA
eukprot:6332970-Amphidinium_carterae.1